MVVHLDVLGGSPGVREDPLGSGRIPGDPSPSVTLTKCDVERTGEIEELVERKKKHSIEGGPSRGGGVAASN